APGPDDVPALQRAPVADGGGAGGQPTRVDDQVVGDPGWAAARRQADHEKLDAVGHLARAPFVASVFADQAVVFSAAGVSFAVPVTGSGPSPASEGLCPGHRDKLSGCPDYFQRSL